MERKNERKKQTKVCVCVGETGCCHVSCFPAGMVKGLRVAQGNEVEQVEEDCHSESNQKEAALTKQ